MTDVPNAIGRSLIRLTPMLFAAWILFGAFGNTNEAIHPWAKGLAVVVAALLIIWTLFLWGSVGDYLFGPKIGAR